MNRTPTLRSAPWRITSWPPIVNGLPNGTTMKIRNAGMIARNGAVTKIPYSTLRGVIDSLKNSLRPSATVCSSPHGPARLGPTRFCILASTLRSIQTLRTVVPSRITNTTNTRPTTIRRSMPSINRSRTLRERNQLSNGQVHTSPELRNRPGAQQTHEDSIRTASPTPPYPWPPIRQPAVPSPRLSARGQIRTIALRRVLFVPSPDRAGGRSAGSTGGCIGPAFMPGVKSEATIRWRFEDARFEVDVG